MQSYYDDEDNIDASEFERLNEPSISKTKLAIGICVAILATLAIAATIYYFGIPAVIAALAKASLAIKASMAGPLAMLKTTLTTLSIAKITAAASSAWSAISAFVANHIPTTIALVYVGLVANAIRSEVMQANEKHEAADSSLNEYYREDHHETKLPTFTYDDSRRLIDHVSEKVAKKMSAAYYTLANLSFFRSAEKFSATDVSLTESPANELVPTPPTTPRQEPR